MATKRNYWNFLRITQHTHTYTCAEATLYSYKGISIAIVSIIYGAIVYYRCQLAAATRRLHLVNGYVEALHAWLASHQMWRAICVAKAANEYMRAGNADLWQASWRLSA